MDAEAMHAAIGAELAEASDGEALTADGFESGLIGVVEGWIDQSRRSVALYDYARCVEILMGQGLDRDEAEEMMEINVCGAYVGPGTPFFAVIYRPPVVSSLES